MANTIELVIKIDEDMYKACQRAVNNPKMTIDSMHVAIANGTPLPKGHGDLKDVSKFVYDCDCGWCDQICYCDNCVHRVLRERDIKNAQMIVGADTEK